MMLKASYRRAGICEDLNFANGANRENLFCQNLVLTEYSVCHYCVRYNFDSVSIARTCYNTLLLGTTAVYNESAETQYDSIVRINQILHLAASRVNSTMRIIVFSQNSHAIIVETYIFILTSTVIIIILKQ